MASAERLEPRGSPATTRPSPSQTTTQYMIEPADMRFFIILCFRNRIAPFRFRVSELSAQISKLLRDNWSHMPIAANPLFFAAQRDGIAGWPLTIGAPWPHYFEYIRAKR